MHKIMMAIAIFSASSFIMTACSESNAGNTDNSDVLLAESANPPMAPKAASDGQLVTLIDEDGEEGDNLRLEGDNVTGSFHIGGLDRNTLPLGFKPYPGSQIISATVADSNGMTGGIVIMGSSDNIEKVIAHYRDFAQSQKLTIANEIDLPESKNLIGYSDEGVSFTVKATRQNNGSQIMLSVGQ